MDKMAGDQDDYDQGRNPSKKTQIYAHTHFPTHRQGSTKNGAMSFAFQRFKRSNPTYVVLRAKVTCPPHPGSDLVPKAEWFQGHPGSQNQ